MTPPDFLYKTKKINNKVATEIQRQHNRKSGAPHN